VLGPLGELGDAEAAAHREIGMLAARLGVDRLVVVGERSEPMQHGATAAGSSAVLVPDVPAALELLRAELAPGDVVLVKASRAFGLERIADGLLGPGPQERGRR
ncbi:MAG: glutamate ligase domain-containing protein, partial [Pseudonocardiaceae bacterium]